MVCCSVIAKPPATLRRRAGRSRCRPVKVLSTAPARVAPPARAAARRGGRRALGSLAGGVLQPGAEAVALEARPQLEKALEQEPPPGLEVDRQRLEAAPGA